MLREKNTFTVFYEIGQKESSVNKISKLRALFHLRIILLTIKFKKCINNPHFKHLCATILSTI